MHRPIRFSYLPDRKIKRMFKNRWKKFAYLIYHRIHKYFPDLYNRISEIEDVRKKSKYKLTEIIMACAAMFIFKEGARNALTMIGKKATSKRIIRIYSVCAHLTRIP